MALWVGSLMKVPCTLGAPRATWCMAPEPICLAPEPICLICFGFSAGESMIRREGLAVCLSWRFVRDVYLFVL